MGSVSRLRTKARAFFAVNRCGSAILGGVAHPLVSVIVPTYNRKRYLRQTLLSLLADQGVSTEIWVVDDASDDGSLETIQDLPVNKIRLSSNGGVSRARNVGLAASRGDLITFFDSDDILAPGGLSHRVEALKVRPEALAVGGVVAGDIGADGELLPDRVSVPPHQALTLDFFRTGGRYCLAPWLYLVRREALTQIGGFDESLRYASDSDLMFRLLALGPVPILPIPVLHYRIHDANLSFSNDEKPVMRPRALAESYLVNLNYGL